MMPSLGERRHRQTANSRARTGSERTRSKRRSSIWTSPPCSRSRKRNPAKIVDDKLLEAAHADPRESSQVPGARRADSSAWGRVRIAAEASTGDVIVAQLRDEAMTQAVLPELVIQYVAVVQTRA